jgi:hypothetical protein
MLLTSGCSFVWGDELEGYNKSPPTHWDKTFTHLLAEKLDMPYVNIARCGNGNRKIFRDTMRYLRSGKHKDEITHMVVLWSAFERDEVAESYGPGVENLMKIQRTQCMTQFSPARIHLIYNHDLANSLDYLYDHYDTLRTQMMETFTYMTALQFTAEQMGIKYVSGGFHYRMWEELVDVMKPFHYDAKSQDRHWGEWMNWIQDELNYLKSTSRLGLNRYTDLATIAEVNDDYKPQLHAGEKSQVIFADLLEEIFLTEFQE